MPSFDISNSDRLTSPEPFAADISFDDIDPSDGEQADGAKRLSGRPTQTRASAENNEARTELLKNLGKQLGLSGVTEHDGKVSFSADFMDKLELLIGKDVLKRESFGIDAEAGVVNSGKPLKERHLQAILDKANLYTDEFATSGIYREKLALIKAGLSGEHAALIDKAIAEFVNAEKCLEFLKNLGKGLVTTTEDKVKEALEEDEKKRDSEKRKKALGSGKSFSASRTAANQSLLDELKKSTGLEIKPSSIKGFDNLSTVALRKHLKLALLSYVKLCCNVGAAALNHGKLDDFVQNLHKSGQDIDMRTRNLVEMEARLRNQ